MVTIPSTVVCRRCPFFGKDTKMEFGKIGDLNVNSDWEKLLASLPQQAVNAHGLGKIWEHIDPPRSDNSDPTVKQGWRLGVIPGVKFVVPQQAEVEVVEESNVGSYTLIRLGRNAIHLRDGVEVVGNTVVGDVHVCARVFWPQGADVRQGGKVAWKNYLLFLDFFPPVGDKVEHDLVVHREGTARDPIVMLGGKKKGTVCWATRSANWKSSLDGADSDQCLVFYKPAKKK